MMAGSPVDSGVFLPLTIDDLEALEDGTATPEAIARYKAVELAITGGKKRTIVIRVNREAGSA